jgi:uncharacterized protein (TIGR02217 family)
MSFYEFRINDEISRGSKGGPVWSTAKAITSSGRRSVNRNWTSPLWRFDVSYGIRTQEDFEEVRDLFMVVYGAFDGFRYKDWHDYQADEETSSVALVSGSTYQLYRRYTRGSRSFDRKITKPVSGSVVILDADGDPISATVDYTAGTFVPDAGTPAAWSGEFDVPVVFMDDTLDTVEIDGHRDAFLAGLGSIRLEEIRL